MKSEEVLRRYSSGERNFQGCQIQGQNFKGKNLSEADFSHADIRGANFTQAILRGAKFNAARAGLQGRWVIIHLAIFLLLSIFSGILLGYCAYLWFDLYSRNTFSLISPFLSLGVCGGSLAVTTVILILQGFTERSLRIIAITSAVFVGLTSFLVGSRLISYAGFNYNSIIPVIISTAILVSVLAISCTIFIAFFTTDSRISIIVVILGIIFGAVFTIVGNSFGYFGSAFVLLTTFSLQRALAETADSQEHLEAINKSAQDPEFISSFLLGLSIPAALALVILFVSLYITWKASQGSNKYVLIWDIAIAFSTIGGTSFLRANLASGDFSKAILKNTDFREAKLTRTQWMKSKFLNRARVGNTYLKNPKIQKLVTTGQGQEQNYDRLNLEGITLKGSNLQDSSFIGASLNYASLEASNMSRARLKQTQLDNADLTGVTLTGAYIEDWGITGTTALDNVHCDYVFMRLPTRENPNPLRKPDNLLEFFAVGEFADFIKPYIDTLDLYHSQNVDPRAISIAFGKLAQDYPEADLEIVAMEKRGENSLNLKVQVAPSIDKSDLSFEYFKNYNQIKSLPIQARLLLSEKDTRIRSLENMIETALKQPTFTVQGDIAMTENQGININSGGNIGDISGLVGGNVSGVVNLGTLSGNVTNAINQLPDSRDSDQPNLKALLSKLKQVIEDSVELSDADKADLLEQVQVLAEVNQTEEPAKQEGLVRKAKKIFDATLKGLPETANIVEACSKLLPMILKVLCITI